MKRGYNNDIVSTPLSVNLFFVYDGFQDYFSYSNEVVSVWPLWKFCSEGNREKDAKKKTGIKLREKPNTRKPGDTVEIGTPWRIEPPILFFERLKWQRGTKNWATATSPGLVGFPHGFFNIFIRYNRSFMNRDPYTTVNFNSQKYTTCIVKYA